jgi:dynactin-4
MIKRSQRCRKCEHNLSKPEYNPSSIKFKIQLAAYYHVPEVVIFRVESPIRHGAKNAIVVKIVNPSQHATTVEFLNASELSEWEVKRQQEVEEASKSEKTSVRNPMLVQAPKHHRPLANATCLVPKGASVFIPPRDDAAEFDDAGPDLQGVVDDKSVVAWRKGNKVGVHMTLDCSAVRPGEEVTAAFALKFMYTNTISALEQKEIQKAHVALPVFLKIGRAQC